MRETKDYELRLCNQGEIDQLIPKRKQKWYINPLCFKHRDKVVVKGNWIHDEYSYPAISIVRCNSTLRGGRCANDTEFEEFMRQTPFYFIN